MGGHGRSKYPAGVVGAKRGRQARIALTQQAAQTNPAGVHAFGKCRLAQLLSLHRLHNLPRNTVLELLG